MQPQVEPPVDVAVFGSPRIDRLHVRAGRLAEGQVERAAVRIAGKVFCPHAVRCADSSPLFADESAMPDVVLEVLSEAVDLEIIAPDPFGMATLPVGAQGLRRLGRVAVTARPEETGGGAERRPHHSG
ncbi:MAG: NAD-specific glutamate dehydrogenase, large form [Nitrospira sp.]|nr:MAG: NAD-specific glutamate dehydrogenase, large form [Nitrospira sp.]